MSSASEVAGPIEIPAEVGLGSRILALGKRMLDGCHSAFWSPTYVPEQALAEDALGPAMAADLIAAQNYARPAPDFKEQLADTTRHNLFRYDRRVIGTGVRTERQGLLQLDRLLRRAKGPVAEGMRESLTFIGAKEFAEGAAGLAVYWKKLLDDDPELQLYVLAPITSSELWPKSDTYLRDRILAHFSDDDLERYKGRLHTTTTKLLTDGPDPRHARIIMLDDWIISGQQMAAAYAFLFARLPTKYEKSIEVNLLTAPQERLSGSVTFWYGQYVPIKAYFLAHNAKGSAYFGAHNHVSGTHSSVDFDFHNLLMEMSEKSLFGWLGRPALAHVVSPYRKMRFTHTERVRHSEEAS